MHEPDQHVSPIKNWKQLVVVVVLAFVVPIVVIIIDSRLARVAKEINRINGNLVQLIRIQSKK